MNVKVRVIGYLADVGITNSQGHARSKTDLPTSILQSKVPSTGINWIVAAITANHRPDLTSQQTSSRAYVP